MERYNELKILYPRLKKSPGEMKTILTLSSSGAMEEASIKLKEYLRNRSSPEYLFTEDETEAFYDENIVKEADAILNGRILGHTFKEGIDWRMNATEGSTRDAEWLWSLARHQWWTVLARAYRQTGREEYAAAVLEQLKDFRKAWPMETHRKKRTANMSYPGDAWRSIEAAIRVYTVWLPLFYYFRSSPSWDGEGLASYLNGIHDHGVFLYSHLTRFTRCANWMLMESSALFQLGLLFPEYKEAEKWKKRGWQNMCQESCYQFDHNGIHTERTPVYHLVSLIAVYQGWELARRNGMECPSYILPTVERGTEFLMALIKPDLSLPMIGDADRITFTDRRADRSVFEGMNLSWDPLDLNELRGHFTKVARDSNRSDFSYFSSGRKDGRPPSSLDYFFPEAGFFVGRSGWKEKDSYLLVTGVQVERGSNAAHSHRDAGHVEYMFQGEDILTDSGRYLYGNCGELDWWRYFASPRSHNVLGVDGFPMGHIPGQRGSASGYSAVRNMRTFVHNLVSRRDLMLLDISHNGYSFLGHPVFHRRRVVFFRESGIVFIEDRVTGEGDHSLQMYFNFAPGELRKDDTEELVYHFRRGHVEDMECRPLLNVSGMYSSVFEGSENPKAGWVSYAYSEKEARPQLVYTAEGDLPKIFCTLFAPSGAAEWEIQGNETKYKILLGIGNIPYSFVSDSEHLSVYAKRE